MVKWTKKEIIVFSIIISLVFIVPIIWPSVKIAYKYNYFPQFLPYLIFTTFANGTNLGYAQKT